MGEEKAVRIWRCGCGVLLGVHKGDELHLKYKELYAIATGRVKVRCRMCARVSEAVTNKAA
jgi:ribosomal protein S27AE